MTLAETASYQRKQARKVQDAQAEKLTRVAKTCQPVGANFLVKARRKKLCHYVHFADSC